MTQLIPLLFVLILPTATHGAGVDPLSLGVDGPLVVMPADAPLSIGPLSGDSLAALADLDGDPTVTTAEEAAMIAVLMQVLGVPPTTEPADPG